MNEKIENTGIFAKNICVLLVVLTLIMIEGVKAQGSAGTDAKLEPRYLVDLPTAGMLQHRSVALDLDFYQEGGLLGGVSVGLFDRLLIGISYGGAYVLGSDKPEWNSTPGVTLRIRILEESIVLPALAIGFDSQGKEVYVDKLSRYAIKSLGFYAVASKNYQAMGFLSFHGGVNYSLERSDGDTDPNIFAGVEKTLGPIISAVAEYNLAMNDSNKDALGRGRGYLNAGLRASLGGGFTLGFNLKDIIKNQQNVTIGNRTVTCEFVRAL